MRHNNNGLSELCDCSRCRGPGRAEGDRTRMVADPRIGRKALLTNAVRTGKEAVQFSGLQGSKTFSSQELAPGDWLVAAVKAEGFYTARTVNRDGSVYRARSLEPITSS